jgi:SAM-dependent methyltransferase
VGHSADVPIPPPELATRVFGLGGWGDPVAAYEEIGAQTRAALLDLLPDDWSFAGRRVLDFGCGAGRTLRQFLAEAEEGELWGADIDAPSIEWLQRSLCPPLHAWRCAPAPPLGLPVASFDLIWTISVFTHLTETSLSWLRELHRLLAPGGLLIATYMGRWNSPFAAGEPWDEDRIGMNVVSHNPDWEAGGPSVLMSDWWVREHWGRAFEILDIAPEVHGQTWVLMRRREVDVSTGDLERPGDDPRELRALRHQVEQVQRELFAALVRERAVRQEYESSLSWRVTRPLREACARVRGRRSS